VTDRRDDRFRDEEAALSDRAACERWLSGLDHADVDALLDGLHRQIGRLNGRPLVPAARYDMLEALRPVLIEGLRRHSAAYSIGSVPLGPAYEADFRRTLDVLAAVTAGYQRCLQEATAVRDPSEVVASACARCLQHLSAQLNEHYRVYRRPPAVLWRELHQLYAIAEERGVLDTIVADRHLEPAHEVTCGRAYAHALLVDLANPGGLQPSQFRLLDVLVDQATTDVAIRRERDERDTGTLVAVDIDGDGGVRLEIPHVGTAGLRYLDISAVARRVRATLTALRGDAPGSVAPFELAGGGDPGEALALVERLQLQWRGGMRGRAHRREHASNTAQVCVGIRSIHYFAGLRRLEEELQLQPRPEAFEAALDVPTEPVIAHTAPAFAMDEWQVVDRSPGGFGLLRPDEEGGRVAHHGLVGLLAPSDEGLLLGVVAWIAQDPDRSLRFGVSFMPGRPAAVSVRLRGADHFEPALLLSGVQEMGDAASIVLPIGWYAAGAALDVYGADGTSWRIELTELVQRGGDFERVRYRKI
jgi:cyclic-di-GMP-binding protein